jgi:quercetin dioxygenase-like cupin family protein
MRTARADRAAASPVERPERFSGNVLTQELAATAEGVQTLAVFFDAGARTRPHRHVHDQILHCFSGEGVVAADDGTGALETHRLRPQDTVVIPSRAWHWHGATRTTAMAHLSILVRDPDDEWEGVEERNWAAYEGG